jgi:hypothetical protein
MAHARTGVDPLQAGWSSLGKGNWAGARSCFEAALAAEERPAALEGLGWAGYCLYVTRGLRRLRAELPLR